MQKQSADLSTLGDITYPRPRLKDHTLDDNLLARSPLTRNGAFCNRPLEDIGKLDSLPIELILALLRLIDLRTLVDFRRVNRRAKEITDSIPQFKLVNTHARNTLQSILSIETGRWIDCDTFCKKLCTAECESCGDFGGYLYVLTCKRVCFLCLSEDPKYLPLSPREAIRKFGIKHSALEILPHMKSIPGIYSPNDVKRYTPLTLVDYESAYQAGIVLHGSAFAMEQYVSEMAAKKSRDYDTRVAGAKVVRTAARRFRRPRTEDLFDRRSRNPLRFMAIVSTPWLNAAPQELEWGFHCIGCRNHSHGFPKNFRRRYNAKSFMEHLRQCGDIKDGKHCQN